MTLVCGAQQIEMPEYAGDGSLLFELKPQYRNYEYVIIWYCNGDTHVYAANENGRIINDVPLFVYPGIHGKEVLSFLGYWWFV